jgi:hypothetical protein
MRHPFITFRPRFIIAHPMSVADRRRHGTGVTIIGYVIIVIAAVAIDLAVACRISVAPDRFRHRI